VVGTGDKSLVDLTLVGSGAGGGGPPAHITATAGHKFYSLDRSSWVPAGDLQIGERLLSGSEVTVSALATRTATTTVYNLTVSRDHTYYVGDRGRQVLVHNCGSDKEIADEVHAAFDVGDDFVKDKITVSVMTTAEGRFAAQAGRGWTEEQLAILAKHGVEPRPFPGAGYHAEKQLLDFAEMGDLLNPGKKTKISIAASRDFCGPRRKNCRALIQAAGGKLISKAEAIF